SGHGIEVDGHSYLLTRDCRQAFPEETGLSMNLLRKNFERLGAGRRVILMDACRNDPRSGKGDTNNCMSDILSKDIRATARASPSSTGGTATALLSACQAGQRAYEWPSKKHGVFTHFLLEGLDGAAWETGRLEFPRLAAHAQREVSRWSRSTPGINLPQEPWYEQFGVADPIILAEGESPRAASERQERESRQREQSEREQREREQRQREQQEREQRERAEEERRQWALRQREMREREDREARQRKEASDRAAREARQQEEKRQREAEKHASSAGSKPKSPPLPPTVLFVYEAMNASGQDVKGEIEATSADEAIIKIRGKGWFPSKVQQKLTSSAAGRNQDAAPSVKESDRQKSPPPLPKKDAKPTVPQQQSKAGVLVLLL